MPSTIIQGQRQYDKFRTGEYVSVGECILLTGCYVDQGSETYIERKLEALCMDCGLDAEAGIDNLLNNLNEATQEGYLWSMHPEESGTVMLMATDWVQDDPENDPQEN